MVAALLLGAGRARAQSTTVPGFALDRYSPAETGSSWFAADSVSSTGHGSLAIGLIGDWAYRPLVLYTDDGSSTAVVKNQIFVYAGISLALWDRLTLAVTLPFEGPVAGNGAEGGGMRFATAPGGKLGDLRLGAAVRVYGKADGAFRLGLGAQAELPTGSRAAYAGDGKLGVRGRLAVAGDLGDWAYAVAASARYRGLADSYADAALGSEVGFVAAVGRHFLDRKLLVGPEIYGSTQVQHAVFKQTSTPVEVVLGAKYRVLPDFVVGLAGGPGLTDGLGSPTSRVLLSLEWIAQPAPPPPPPPPPPVKRAPPPPPPPPSPPPAKDSDGDGIADPDDACPNEPGPKNDDAAKNGCPLPKDSDGDGIIDTEDACPNDPGPRNADPAKNGCPTAVVKGEQIIIMERIEFDTDKATIRPESTMVLDAVLTVLGEHPEIAALSVEGHTDNHGGRAHNKRLSKRRATAVVKWLVSHGVAKNRLSAAGYGQEKPIDSNDAVEGRQNNRRVEFHIVGAKP